MPDQAFIYLIVALNALVQTLLIRSLKLPRRARRKYYALTIALPVLVIVTMRLLVASGVIQAVVAEQSMPERWVTTGASVLLLAAPWLVTVAAILDKRRQGALANSSRPE